MINIFLDDIRQPPPDDDREWIVVTTAWQCIALVGRNPRNIDTLSLDHDLGEDLGMAARIGPGSGYDVAKWLEGCANERKYIYVPRYILCHSANPVGRTRILQAVAAVYALRSLDTYLIAGGIEP